MNRTLPGASGSRLLTVIRASRGAITSRVRLAAGGVPPGADGVHVGGSVRLVPAQAQRIRRLKRCWFTR